MKKVLFLILFLISIFAHSQSEQDKYLLSLINQERMSVDISTLDLYNNYTDFDYFIDYTLRIENDSEKEIKRCISHINNFIDEYYPNVSNVYYAGICSQEQPTPEYLLKILITSSNFPYDCTTRALPKIILYRVDGKWVGFIYILTFTK